MEESIQVILEAVPLWERLLTLLAPLVGGALAVIAGILLERRRSTRLQRREHLREIQHKVFWPLEQKIRRYFLPILLPAISNIALQEQHILVKGAVATDYLWERQEQLEVVRPDLSTLELSSDALYDCSKRVHYPEVVQRYEALEADINDYNSQCLEYVQSLANKIEHVTGLRKHSLSKQGSPWVRSEALALHIYQRQQGLVSYGVRLLPGSDESATSSRVELPDGSGVIHKATLAEAEKALQLVTELENNKERVDQLRNRAATLRHRASDLGADLERLLHTSSLRGKCALLNE